MWDYDAFPVWVVDGPEGYGPMVTDLPISNELRVDLQRWSDQMTALAWGEDGPDAPGAEDRVIPPDVLGAWDAEGDRLVERLSRELGDAVMVGRWRARGQIDWLDGEADDL